MITLAEWMKTIKHQITEGSNYNWDCYGDNAYVLSYWDQDQDGVETGIVVDKENDTVYECTVCDFEHNLAYRIINPLFKDAYDGDVEQHNLDYGFEDMAWDDVPYYDLEEEDFNDKLTAIVNYEPYDDRAIVSLNLSKEELFDLMKLAHTEDITLNQLVENILQSYINYDEKDVF